MVDPYYVTETTEIHKEVIREDGSYVSHACSIFLDGDIVTKGRDNSRCRQVIKLRANITISTDQTGDLSRRIL